jgi:hypothetical protein
MAVVRLGITDNGNCKDKIITFSTIGKKKAL